MPPEYYDHTQVDLNKQSFDIWALGVSLFCIAFGFLPFQIKDTLEPIPDNWEIKWSEVDNMYNYNIKLKSFINNILTFDHHSRPDINDIL